VHYPHYQNQVANFVGFHRQNLAEGVLLALYYASAEAPEDVFLFEVVGPIGEDTVSPDSQMLQVEFASTPDFPLADGGRLHMTITTPAELQAAIAGNWHEVREIRQAVSRQQCQVAYKEEKLEVGEFTQQLLGQEAKVAA